MISPRRAPASNISTNSFMFIFVLDVCWNTTQAQFFARTAVALDGPMRKRLRLFLFSVCVFPQLGIARFYTPPHVVDNLVGKKSLKKRHPHQQNARQDYRRRG